MESNDSTVHVHDFQNAYVAEEDGHDVLVLGKSKAETVLPEAVRKPTFSMDHITLYDNDLPGEVCRDIIQRFETDTEQYEGVTVTPDGHTQVNPGFKSCKEVAISGRADWKDIDETVQQHVIQAIANLRLEYPALRQMGGCADSGYRIKRYLNNGVDKFDWHLDFGGMTSARRYMVLIWYLNTVAVGGETQFKHQNIGVKPVEGRLAAFPPYWTHEHRGDVPVSEPKYILSSWVLL